MKNGGSTRPVVLPFGDSTTPTIVLPFGDSATEPLELPVSNGTTQSFVRRVGPGPSLLAARPVGAGNELAVLHIRDRTVQLGVLPGGDRTIQLGALRDDDRLAHLDGELALPLSRKSNYAGSKTTPHDVSANPVRDVSTNTSFPSLLQGRVGGYLGTLLVSSGGISPTFVSASWAP